MQFDLSTMITVWTEKTKDFLLTVDSDSKVDIDLPCFNNDFDGINEQPSDWKHNSKEDDT